MSANPYPLNLMRCHRSKQTFPKIRIGDRDGDQVGIPDRITHIIHITHILRYRPEHTVPITPEGIWPITIQPEAIAEVAAELITIQMAVTEEAQPDVRRQ